MRVTFVRVMRLALEEWMPRAKTGPCLIAFLAAAILSVLSIASAQAQENCSSVCSGKPRPWDCISSCRQSAELARSRADLQEHLSKENETLLPAFRSARDKLWETDPKSPHFLEVFKAYKSLRVKRDQALIMAYASVLGIQSVFTGGAEFQALDERYMVPQVAAGAFHEYAMAELKKTIQMFQPPKGPEAITQEMDQLYGGKGSYFKYLKLADEQELSVWPAKHGGPRVEVTFPNGDPKSPDIPTISESQRQDFCIRKARREQVGSPLAFPTLIAICLNSNDPSFPPYSARWPKKTGGETDPRAIECNSRVTETSSKHQTRDVNANMQLFDRLKKDCRNSDDPELPPSTSVWPKDN